MVINKKMYVVFIIAAVIFSCNKAEDLTMSSFLRFEKPTHFPQAIYQLADNSITQKTFELGRKLFYDPILSRNNTIACGSCHVSQHGFTHHGHDVSHGIDDQLGIRNSMPLFNLAWSPSFFWDGGVHDIDLSPMVPIENPVEMDEKINNVLYKLQNSTEYPKLFKDAFGNETISSANLFKALSYFMLMLVSADSKYDKVQKGLAEFTEDEQKGYTLFQSKCNSCHTEPLFTDYSFRDNGIGINPYNDYGRFQITNLEEDKLKFKVPSLRNLKYTTPYMHDGRFYSLRAVLNHYANEIQQTQNLDPLLNGGIYLSDQDISYLLAFLNTLNDEQFINNKLFAEQ